MLGIARYSLFSGLLRSSMMGMPPRQGIAAPRQRQADVALQSDGSKQGHLQRHSWLGREHIGSRRRRRMLRLPGLLLLLRPLDVLGVAEDQRGSRGSLRQ